MAVQAFIAALGRQAYLHRWRVLLLWGVLWLLLLSSAVRLPSVLVGAGFSLPGQASTVAEQVQQQFGDHAAYVVLLFDSEDYTPEQSPYRQAIAQSVAAVDDIDTLVARYLPKDHPEQISGSVAYALLAFNQDEEAIIEEIHQIRSQLAPVQQQLAEQGIQLRITGQAVFDLDINETSQLDLLRAELIGVPAALVVLLFAFGSLRASLVPIVVGALVVPIALGAFYWWGLAADLSIFLLNVVPMIGLTLSIDFALLMISRFREEARQQPIDIAIERVVATAGHSVVISGLCVFFGFASLLFFQVEVFKTVAYAGMVMVGLSLLGALSFLPALLAVCAPWLISATDRLPQVRHQLTIWQKSALFVMRHPLSMALLAITVLLVCLLPVRQLELTVPGVKSVPDYLESRQAYEDLEAVFGEGFLNPVLVIIDEDSGALQHAAGLNDLAQLVDSLNQDPAVRAVHSVFSLTGLGPQALAQALANPDFADALAPALSVSLTENSALLRIVLDDNPHSATARAWVAQLEQQLADTAFIDQYLIGGMAQSEREIYQNLRQQLPYALGFILLTTFVMLYFAFGSIVIPTKAILMNILSLSATFGILVWIFQQGHFSELLNFEPQAIGVVIPIFIFSIAFGLSMDYEVFLISRMHEHYLKTGDNDAAVLTGLSHTSRIITYAALIIIVITGAFAFTDVLLVKQMGVGIALVIAIDATLVRLILVPAMMKLFGRWNWWSF